MNNVVELDVVTTHDIPIDRVLRRAAEKGLTTVVVVGWDENGELYFSSSVADGGEVLWLFEKAKKSLLEVG